MQRTISVFLASSDELIHDRNSIQALISSLDDIYEERGVRIKCKRWEDFNAFCTGERTQDQYNKVLEASDVCLCMFHRKAGRFTIEEFNHALDEYRQNNDHPKTYVYIRALADGEVEEQELKTFKESLFQTIGHYWCNYATDDAMKLHFVMQIERMMTPMLPHANAQSSNLKVENGSVLLHGRKIADYSNLSFAACNTEYTSLKEKIEGLDKEIVQFRAMGIEALKPMILSKSSERNRLYEDLKNLEEQLFSIALSVNKMTSSGLPVSERKRMAIEMFEKGNIKGVIEVLNENDLALDAERAKAEIARGKQLVEVGNATIESGVQKIRSLVEEYEMRAEALMADNTVADRLQQACQAYEQVISLAREHLTEEELAKKLLKIANFLHKHNMFEVAEDYFKECLGIYRRLALDNPKVYESNLAESLNDLAVLYSNTQRFFESEKMYKEALEICRRLAMNNPEAFEPDLAEVLNNLAVLYFDIQRFPESELLCKESLKIYRRLALDIPATFRLDLAETLNNLACLYIKTQRFPESELLSKESLEIYRRLVLDNPSVYEPDLAVSLNNLAFFYFKTQRFPESEMIYNETLEILRRLALDNPAAYEPDLALTLNNFALLYSNIQRFLESELLNKEALDIRRRLAMNNPEAFEPDLARSFCNLAILYFNTQQFSESELLHKESLEIRRRLVLDNPEAFEADLARSLYNLAQLYTETQRFSESEAMYKEALEIYRRLAVDKPTAYESNIDSILSRLEELNKMNEKSSIWKKVGKLFKSR